MPNPDLSQSQFGVLLAIADAFIPALNESEIQSITSEVSRKLINPKWGAIRAYLEKSCVDDPLYQETVKSFIRGIPEKSRNDLASFLDILHGGGLLALPFTRTMTSFPKIDRAGRVQILQNWSNSSLSLLQNLFGSLKRLCTVCHLRTSEVAFRAMEYPEPGLDTANNQVGESGAYHQFSFFQFPSRTDVATVDVDIVVIGSGAGGSVVAAKLANQFKGVKKIMILEKGEFIPPKAFPLAQKDTGRIYDGNVAAFMSEDEKGVIVAGNTWGGGTVVNFCGSWELPQATREEWAKRYGLEFTTGPDFQKAYDRISERIGVSTDNIKHSRQNEALVEGANRLGLNVQSIPQNVRLQEHNCGFCGYGCQAGMAGKQSCAVTYLVDAEKAGAICVQNCEVTRILTGSNGEAKGVTALVDGTKEVRVNAGIVVVCGSAVRTPCILLQSGFKNKNIGKNLTLHPQMFALGYFDNKEVKVKRNIWDSGGFPVASWEGAIMTVNINACHNKLDKNYGMKLFAMAGYPSMVTYTLPWVDPVAWRTEVLRSRQALWTSVVLRDRESVGSITLDKRSGQPIVQYTLAASDREVRAEAAIIACKVYLEAGADEVHPILNGGETDSLAYRPPADRNYEADPKWAHFTKYLRKSLGGRNWTSPHPMGTCRMGTDPSSSVVDLSGNVWGHPGVYVADSSLFPGASGVNPMLTIMALADRVAEKIAATLA